MSLVLREWASMSQLFMFLLKLVAQIVKNTFAEKVIHLWGEIWEKTITGAINFTLGKILMHDFLTCNRVLLQVLGKYRIFLHHTISDQC